MSEAVSNSVDLHIDSKGPEPKQAWYEDTSQEKKDQKSKRKNFLGKIGDIVWGTEDVFAFYEDTSQEKKDQKSKRKNFLGKIGDIVWGTEDVFGDIKEEDKPFKTKFDIILDYSGYATIQGLNYIFFDYQSIFGKLFWSVTITLMLVLGMYCTVLSYLGWQAAPVLTTITTTALTVEDVDFPAVTFCNPGSNKNILTAAIINEFFNYSSFVNDTPYNIASAINQMTTQSMMSTDIEATPAYQLVEANAGDFMNELQDSFLTNKLPGFKGTDLRNIGTILTLLATTNPDAVLNTLWSPLQSGFQPQMELCESGYTPDAISPYCYKVIKTSKRLDFNGSQGQCNIYDSLLQYFDDMQIMGFSNMLMQGKLQLSNSSIFVNAIRNGSSFIFVENGKSISSFPLLVLAPDVDPSLNCLTITLDGSFQAQLILQPTNCESQVATAVVCMYQYMEMSLMSLPEFILNPMYKKTRARNWKIQKEKYFELISRFTKNVDFESFYSVLWHTTLPCYDVKGITGSDDGDSSILKYCEWKGVPHPCSLMFDTFPTDHGMCCSFNMRKAEEIFNGETYPKTIQNLQERDRVNSFKSVLTPLNESKPSTVAGRSKGLVVMLDSHSNIVSPGTVDTDFNGFFGMISPPGEFPSIDYGGFLIRPGSINEISLTSTVVVADDGLRTLDPVDRGCKFAEENDLIIHKKYSMTNCLFECALLYAYDQIGHNCTPWFFPSVEKSMKICNPWQSAEFFDIMSRNIPEDKCLNCLPDCNVNRYQKTITTVPFRKCNSINLGVSLLCNLSDIGIILRPQLFSDIVLTYYGTSSPSYIANFIKSKNRSPFLSSSQLFGSTYLIDNAMGYNAYEKDIAMVKIFFDTPTVLEIGTQPVTTWIDFLANVGGLLGLVLGMGIISFVELIWLALRLIAHTWNLTYWIP